MEQIAWEDFQKIDMRVGTVVDVQDFPEARRPAYKVKVDFGPEIGIKKSSAQITANHSKTDLLGRQVICVVNFKPKQIANYFSEILITGVADEAGNIVLATPESQVPNGGKLH